MKHLSFYNEKIRYFYRTVFSVLLFAAAALSVFYFSLSEIAVQPRVLSPSERLHNDETLSADRRLHTLLREHEAYGAYILGSFPANGYDTETLSAYLKTGVYRLTTPGNDLEQTSKIFHFITDSFQPKIIFVSLSACDLYTTESLQSAYTLPDYRTGGVYRGFDDVERIGALDAYMRTHGDAFSVPFPERQASAEACLTIIADMRRVCKEKGIRLVVVLSPSYAEVNDKHVKKAFEQLKEGLNLICPYWDFSDETLCSDARFFYTPHEFRPAFGNMILARMFGDGSVYVPESFGAYVSGAGTVSPIKRKSHILETDVPVLLYHHLTQETGYGDAVISVSRFEEHLAALKQAGYEAVSLRQLEDYVIRGKKLPEKPVCITFDDGYLSNYTLAYPLLEKYDMRAAIFVIGWAMGKDSYKNTAFPIIPHFDFAAVKEMSASERVEIASHTYDMHQTKELEPPGKARVGALPLPGESTSAYIKALRDDYRRFAEMLESNLLAQVSYLSYPHGLYSPLSEKIFAEEGALMTFSTEYDGKNTLVCGLPQSLRALYRFTVSESADAAALLSMIDKVYGK